MGNPSQNYGVAIWDHTVICHPTQANTPRLNGSLATQAGTLIYLPGGMEG